MSPTTTTVRVPLPEASLERLYAVAAHQGRDLETAAGLMLAASLVSLPAEGRYTVLGGPDLLALEDLLGGGSILNATDLRQKVERLAGISFQHVRLQFTPGQLEQLLERATRQGKSVEQLVEQMAPRIHEQFFGLIDTRG